MTGPRHLARKETGGAALKFAEFSPDGGLFAICYFPNSGATARACIADAMTGETRQDFETSLPFVRGVGVASGGGHLAVAHITKSVMLTYAVLG